MLLKAALSCLLLAGACVARAPLSITELKDVIDHLGDEILEHKSINSASGFPMVDEIEGREDDTEDQDLPDVFDDEVPHPVAVNNWGAHLDVGQVSGVAVDPNDNPVILNRGCHNWDDKAFDEEFRFVNRTPIPNDVVVTVDPDTAEVRDSWGSNMFYMPHGLTIDSRGNHYITDVGLHQVMRFPVGSHEPDLVLGESFVPGSDGNHFCQPTSIAVSEDTGIFFVGDGYCNSRILKFSRQGRLLKIINGDWRIVHSLALFEDEDVLCLSDREGQRIDCIRAGLRVNEDNTGEDVITYTGVGRTFAIAAKGTSILSLSGLPLVRGITIDTAAERPKILDEWGLGDLSHPHDLAISSFGDSVYVADVEGPTRLHKFEVVRTGDFP